MLHHSKVITKRLVIKIAVNILTDAELLLEVRQHQLA